MFRRNTKEKVERTFVLINSSLVLFCRPFMNSYRLRVGINISNGIKKSTIG